MSYSLNEIDSLAKKAARGAGFSWGMAEEAGKSARWLASFGLPGPALLLDLLRRHDQLPRAQFSPGAISQFLAPQGGEVCPIAGGTMLCDSADSIHEAGGSMLNGVVYPLLIVPFAASASRYLNLPLVVSWASAAISIGAEGISVEGQGDALTVTKTDWLKWEFGDDFRGTLLKPSFRGEIPQEVLSGLNSFAQRTYAPATEESRILGAGAGLGDND